MSAGRWWRGTARTFPACKLATAVAGDAAGVACSCFASLRVWAWYEKLSSSWSAGSGRQGCAGPAAPYRVSADEAHAAQAPTEQGQARASIRGPSVISLSRLSSAGSNAVPPKPLCMVGSLLSGLTFLQFRRDRWLWQTTIRRARATWLPTTCRFAICFSVSACGGGECSRFSTPKETPAAAERRWWCSSRRRYRTGFAGSAAAGSWAGWP